MRLYGYIRIALLTILASAQALVLNFVDIQTTALQNNMSEVNFIAPGNNFAGIFFRLAHQNLDTPQEITIGMQTIQCNKQLRGLYYNAQRGERIRPIDTDTLQLLQDSSTSYNNMTLDGGLYTFCSGTGVDPRSIVGQVQYTNGTIQSTMLGGLQYSYEQNTYQLPFANSFQYIVNTTPVGYIYDTIGGIAFVGGLYTQQSSVLDAIASGENITDIFQQSGDQIVAYNEAVIMSATGWYITPGYISVDGVIGITSSLSGSQTTYIASSQQNALILPTASFTTADITNQLRKIAFHQCQGHGLSTSIADQGPILCFQYPSYMDTNTITIDLAQNEYANKVIFVKNGDIHLQGTMNELSSPLQLFIDNGNIVRNTSGAGLISFDQNGNIGGGTVAQGLFLKGNILVDGLIISDGGSSFSHKVFIHGKMLSLNTLETPSLGRISHITQKFTPYDYTAFVSLEDIFSRRCNPATGVGTDGTSCGGSDPYTLSPLILIDRYFPSILLQ